MLTKPNIIRKLSPIEEALTISNEVYPLCVVCVLHLLNAPSIEKVEGSLVQIQERHLLLRAGILKQRGRFYFYQLEPVKQLELVVLERNKETSFRKVTEQALNTTFDKAGPLMKCYYLPNIEKGPSELVVCFHHAIIDGASARLILHELLSLLGNVSLPASLPMVIPGYPDKYKGFRLLRPISQLIGRQISEEWNYNRKGLSSPIPPASQNATLSINLSSEISRKLSVRAGRMGLSLNSVLLAAITLAHSQKRHELQSAQMVRVISFADLRSSMMPPLEREELGCFISMVRLAVPISLDTSVWQVGQSIRRGLFKASRRGEVFLMSIMSKYLFKMAFRMHNSRLGVSGISYIGKLNLEPQYGAVQLKHVEAYITNNRLGPEISAFGKVLFGRIGLDFTYLSSEMSPEQAQQIVEAIKGMLEKMANLP